MSNARDTDMMDRELTDAELDVIDGGIAPSTLALAAACLLSPAFGIGFAAGVAYRTLTE